VHAKPPTVHVKTPLTKACRNLLLDAWISVLDPESATGVLRGAILPVCLIDEAPLGGPVVLSLLNEIMLLAEDMHLRGWRAFGPSQLLIRCMAQFCTRLPMLPVIDGAITWDKALHADIITPPTRFNAIFARR
jgi:hypothetical protein